MLYSRSLLLIVLELVLKPGSEHKLATMGRDSELYSGVSEAWSQFTGVKFLKLCAAFLLVSEAVHELAEGTRMQMAFEDSIL